MFIALLAAITITTGDGLPVKSPTAVGMSAARLEAIDRVVGRGISAGGYPGAAVIVGRNGAAVVQKGYGTLGWTDGSGRVTADRTIYDLASLTKVVGTTTAIMLLFDEGRLSLDKPVVTYLPAFTGGFKDSVTVRQLLMHRGGLPAGRDLWRTARSPAEARQLVIDTPLACRPGDCFVYSDLGADLLGMIAETVAGKTLDLLLQERVFGPLGMTDTGFRPADSLRYRIAPTEVTPPRGYPLRGEVHDENAYALGGVAGHAGLFSTASDLAVFAQMMLNGGEYNGTRILADTTVTLFTRRAAGTRGLGWDTCNGNYGCGEHLDEGAYGHTGYTGTSLWIDPERQLFVILLTNRVHAARARRPAKVISDVRSDLADAAAAAVMDDPDNILAMPVAFRADRAIGWNVAARRPTSARSRTASARSRAARAARARSTKRTAATRARTSSTRKVTASKLAAKKTAASKSTAKKTAASRSIAKKTAASKSITSKSGSAKKKVTASKAGSAKSRSSTAKTSAPKRASSAKHAPVKKTSAKKTSAKTARTGRTRD